MKCFIMVENELQEMAKMSVSRVDHASSLQAVAVRVMLERPQAAPLLGQSRQRPT